MQVLVVDASPLHLHLLCTALRRRTELRCHPCDLEVEAVLSEIERRRVDVVLLNAPARDEHNSVLSTARRIHLAHPRIPMVLLHQNEREFAVDAVRAGIRGLFSLGENPFRALCKCIQRVHEGQIWISNDQTQELVIALAQTPPLRVVNAHGSDLLSPREEQVVALVAEGLSNRAIAAELRLSEHTVKKYMFRIFDKLGISTRVELVLYAVSNGGTVGVERLLGAG